MTYFTSLVKGNALFGVALFLMYTDVFVPPAALPAADKQTSQDRLGDANKLLLWVWGLSAPQQLAFSAALAALWTICCGAIVRPFVVDAKGHQTESTSWVSPFKAFAFCIAVGGFALRFWAKQVLADSFTYRISVPRDDQLVTAAPYDMLLHPGYSGVIVHIFGIFLLLLAPVLRGGGSSLTRRFIALGIVFAVVAVVVQILRVRMEDEEKMLASHFGEQWTRHASTRWKLVPGIY